MSNTRSRNTGRTGRLARTLLLSSAMLVGMTTMTMAPAYAQDAEAADADEEATLDTVVITGYRGALQNSTDAKRDSNGFSDTIFADDIGKLPSQNLAESLNRVPGVKIGRDVTGEGQQISVRGLGPQFTKVVLNGSNLWSASDGALNSTNRDRQVDLDFLPADLFTALRVDKTPMAHQMEGGTSGFVNLRTARPFDNPGFHVRGSLEGIFTEIDEELSPQASFVISNTYNDKFGVLFGAVVSNKTYRVDGYETVGYSDSCIADYTNPPTNTTSNCAPGLGSGAGGAWQGRNHFQLSPYATADYVAAHPELGLAVGDPIDPVATSGLTLEQLDRGILPYLGRGHFTWGDRDSMSLLGAVQFQPNDTMEFGVDVLYSELDKQFERVTTNNWGRRNWLHLDAAWIPEDWTYDSENEIINSGRIYNTHLWVEQRPYVENFEFMSIMPYMSWDISDMLTMDLSASYSDTSFYRSEITFNFLSPATTVDFDTRGDVGTFDYAVDVSQPNIGWVWNDVQNDQMRFRRNYRDTETLGLHLDFAYGEDPDRTGLKFGAAYDEASRDMTTYSFQNEADLKNNFLFPSDPYTNIQAYMMPAPFTFGGSFDDPIGHPAVAVLNSGAVFNAMNFSQFTPTIKATSDQFGAGVGNIEETYSALYVEGNAESNILDRPLRINAGVRWVNTDQTLSSLDSAAVNVVETDTSYSTFLPSFSLTYDALDDLKLRASASRTMTRANPGIMYPRAGFTTSGIESAAAGNPNLKPFESINFDIGGEYYYGDLGGYFGLYYFQKEVRGFTRNDVIDVLFADLDTYGLSSDPASLTPTQQAALTACGGPNSCTVRMSTTVNIETPATLQGYEAIWVQPLDFIVKGLGFNASATTIEQDAEDPGAIITGISDWTYNLTGYYENDFMSARLTYYSQDGAIVSGFTDGFNGQNGSIARRISTDDRKQIDFATSFNLPMMEQYNLTLTFEGYNITDEPVRSIYEHPDLTNDIYYSGATYTVGLRAQF